MKGQRKWSFYFKIFSEILRFLVIKTCTLYTSNLGPRTGSASSWSSKISRISLHYSHYVMLGRGRFKDDVEIKEEDVELEEGRRLGNTGETICR